jgi:hypothetical protein
MVNIMKKVIILLLMLTKVGINQELKATVTVKYDNLPVINKESLINFAQTVSDYLNNTKFTGEAWNNPKVECTFNIFFQSASSLTGYVAQVFVGSQREIYKSLKKSPMLIIMDNNWSFVYEKNQSLYYNPNVFNSLTSFLDYYAYLIIGMDNDSWDKLSGTPLFTKASNLVNQGINSGNSTGWDRGSGYNRRDLVEDLLNDKYRTVREAAYEYHYGLDYFAKNKAIGQQKMANIAIVLNSIKSKIDARSIYVRTFFDAKAGEIVEYLKDYSDKINIFKLLKAIDPPHISKYDEGMK